MPVEIICMDRHKQSEYLKEHNIKQINGLGLFGCCIVKQELVSELQTILVFERFDGVMQAINLNDLVTAEEDLRLNSEVVLRDFKMFNMILGGDNYDPYVESYCYRKEYNRSKYKPTIESIKHYIWANWKEFQTIETDDIVIKATKLTKEELDKIVYKLKMTGLRCGFVDYNTFAVGKNGKVAVYSAQKRILTDDDIGKLHW
jgi:hypothetical protein